MDSYKFEIVFVVRQMDGCNESVSLRYRKGEWMNGLVIV